MHERTTRPTVRTGVLVLGVHRSGTSVTTGLLARLGLALPRTLMPSNSWNAGGYFESSRLHLLHDRMLRAAGTSWDAYTRLDPEWLQSDEARAMRLECRDILRSEFGDAPRFVVKDPRICRFVPFWRQVLDDEHIHPKAVLVVRPAFEVARSLQARDGFPLALGALLWLRHVLDAEADTRTIPRAWAQYADTLQDWRSMARRISVDLDEDGLCESIDRQGDDLVDRSLRHHEGSLDPARMPEMLLTWLRRTEEALARLQASDSAGRRQGSEAFDAIRAEFDQTTALSRSADEPRHLDLSHERDALQEVQATLSDAIARHETQLRKSLAALDVSRSEVAALRGSMSWRLTAPLRAVGRLVK